MSGGDRWWTAGPQESVGHRPGRTAPPRPAPPRARSGPVSPVWSQAFDTLGAPGDNSVPQYSTGFL